MQLRHLDYVPVLKWRQGEYLALSKMSDDDKDWITPLLEVTPPEFDFESQRVSKTLDRHFAPFAKRLKTKWGTRPAFLDTRHLNATDRMTDGTHPLTFLLAEARAAGARLIPVTNLERDLAHDNALASALLHDGRGVALRCTLDDFGDAAFDDNVRRRLADFEVGTTQTHLLIDLADTELAAADDLADLLIACLEAAPVAAEVASLVILGTGFPGSMGDVAKGLQSIPRTEWKLYKALLKKLPSGLRTPSFGDYAIASPHLVTGDMRRLKPAATVRIAVEDAWMIAKGGAARGNLGQFKGLCQTIKDKVKLREGASAGADYVRLCADGKVPTGTQTTWRWVGTNHHLTTVLADLAKLYEP